jgi:hypothetical protein
MFVLASVFRPKNRDQEMTGVRFETVHVFESEHYICMPAGC